MWSYRSIDDNPKSRNNTMTSIVSTAPTAAVVLASAAAPAVATTHMSTSAIPIRPMGATTTSQISGTTQQRLDVTLKLTQLQNLCKRDPVAYYDDYSAQVRRLSAELQVMTHHAASSTSISTTTTPNTTTTTTTPNMNTTTTSTSKSNNSNNSNSGNTGDSTVQRVVELVQFVAAVSSSSYKGTESDQIGTLLIGLLGGIRTTTNTTPTTTSTSTVSSAKVGTTNSKGKQLKHRRSASPSSKGTSTTTSTNTGSTIIIISPQQSMMVSSLHRDVRRAVVSALILMRNKGCIVPLDLLQLFFTVMSLTSVVDKTIKELLYRHIVNDIRNINKKGKRDDKVNRSIQTFLHRILQSSSAVNSNTSNSHNMMMIDDGSTMSTLTSEMASKRAVDMVCELYRRRVWTDDRTVAILASAVLHPHTSVSCRAMRFFLNIEEKMAHDTRTQKEIQIAEKGQQVDLHLHSRKTSRRQRQTERALKNKKRIVQKNQTASEWMDETPNHDKGVEQSKKLYPAIELLRDPQGMVELLFRRLKSSATNIKYDAKILIINFITRLAGNHELLFLPLYSYLQKYMLGHQKDVTAVLAYSVQACHNLIPPDEIYGIIKTIAHHFITERCSEEQMAVGINAVRAICARVPTCMSKEESNDTTNDDDAITSSSNKVTMDMEAFARDLASYANHRDRSVAIAGKAWLNFVREVNPSLLAGKDRGLKGSAIYKTGAASFQPARYGEFVAPSGVEGADLLVEYEAKKKQMAALRRQQQQQQPVTGKGENTEEDADNDEWEDMDEDDEEVNEDNDGWEEVEDDDDDNQEDDDAMDDSGEWEDVEEEDDDEAAPDLIRLEVNSYDKEATNDEIVVPDLSKMTKEERDKLKQEVSSTRIFTTEDFIKMRKLVERENRAKHDPREAARRKRAIAQGRDFIALSDDDNDDDNNSTESETESLVGDDRNVNIKGTVNPEDIMALSARKRQSRAMKLEKVLAGRTKFETKQRAGGSTNIEKKRGKNFIMSKFSQDARSKGRGKSHSQSKKRDRPKNQKGTHEAKKRRRKV